MKKRCSWATKSNKEFYIQYHDKEWGIPVHDDQKHFEMLILEGAQAGLNWETILKRREDYRKAFHNFNVTKVMNMSDQELQALMENSAIIRNRLKIYSARHNAQIFLHIQKEFGSFDNYIWGFVNHAPIINERQNITEIPATTKESDALSKDLKKRGMKFVGSTIMYAYMQAIGMVNDHLIECWRHGL